jgi:hypothetical protein
MVAAAQAKLGDDARIEVGDVRTFDAGRTFDAVLCLNGTIGYLLTADLDAALGRLCAHVSPDGVLLLEPWCSAEQWLAPQTSAEAAKEGDLAVSRVSRAYVDEDGFGVFDWYVTVATPEGVSSFVESHRLSLRPVETYLTKLDALGFDAHHTEFPGRGLGIVVATRRP